MVLLTMTPPIVEAIKKLRKTFASDDDNAISHEGQPRTKYSESRNSARLEAEELDQNDSQQQRHGPIAESFKTEPCLARPAVGNPISHGQIIDISEALKATTTSLVRLEHLLRGAKLYVHPPTPKKEPSSEYKALMARLRAEEEARSYERMTHPPLPMETFSQRFPMTGAAHAFSNLPKSSDEEDDVTYADVDRQMALIFNVLVSIVACAGAIWVAARWWSTPTRLAISMSGSLLVGVAEVVVYSGYIRRVGDAKAKAKQVKEVKEVVNSWVVGGEGGGNDETSVEDMGKRGYHHAKIRRRKNEKCEMEDP